MDLLRIEQQRRALEQNLQTLRTTLKHWQTWEAEYEGLKEEIESVGDGLDGTALAKISQTYDGELVNEREIRDLTGLSQPTPRSASQILGMITRRQEYVQKNIETTQRRFWVDEGKLEELDFAAFSAANRGGDADFPLTEIHEELDEDGNIISSSTSNPETATTQLVDSLRKAGLSDQDLSGLIDGASPRRASTPATAGVLSVSPVRSTSPSSKQNESNADESATLDYSSHDESGPERPPIRKKSVSFTADTKSAPDPIRVNSEEGKKSVSFAERVSVAPAAPTPEARSVSFSPKIEEIPAQPSALPAVQASSDSDIQKPLRAFFKPGDKVIELDDDDEVAAMHVVMPEDESPEDAQMRRDMLEYHLNEVGHVVAQLDLDEDEGYGDGDDTTSASDFAPSEYQDEDTPYTSGGSESEDEDEDEYGRTRRRVLTDDYHKEMRDLERRLIGNLGPAPSDQDIQALDPELDPQDVHRLVVREKRSSISSISSDGEKKPGNKKRVSFAQALDVPDQTAPTPEAIKTEDGEPAAAVKEAIAERTTTMPTSLPNPTGPEKVSKFKQARTAPISDISDPVKDLDDDDHSGPPGKIIADQLVERAGAAGRDAPLSPDELETVAEQRQLAAEYYRRRNEIVRAQGGFKRDEDDEDAGVELMEERDGKLKKVSRFKAARIRP